MRVNADPYAEQLPAGMRWRKSWHSQRVVGARGDPHARGLEGQRDIPKTNLGFLFLTHAK